MSNPRDFLKASRRLVVKVGSSLLTAGGERLDAAFAANIAEQIAQARGGSEREREIALVSSGAIAAGVARLGWQKMPESLADMQVAAAVGQASLMDAYETAFARFGAHTAQVLLTAEGLAHRTLYLNARAALRRMLETGALPVINENDVTATYEVRFSDNDILAAQVANLLEADALILLTTAPGLVENWEEGSAQSAQPTQVLKQASAVDDSLHQFVRSEKNSAVGRGGMTSKLQAARVAARSGAHTLIADGREENIIARILGGEEIGTLLCADIPRLSARKQWLASGLAIKGALILDNGAVAAITGGGRSLLPIGVTGARGVFARGDAVSLENKRGQTIAYGLCNYGADEIARIQGKNSANIAAALGYAYEEEVMHRDNMTVVVSS